MTQSIPSTEFERESCPRCGGGGHYSYCQMYGTTCFKCAGLGKVLTKRGHAARAWYVQRHTVPAAELQVGDRVHSGGAKFTIVEIEQSGSYCSHTVDGVEVKTYYTNLYSKDRKFRYAVHLTTLVQRLPKDNAQKNEWLREAFAYQDTLGKSGKPLRQREAL